MVFQYWRCKWRPSVWRLSDFFRSLSYTAIDFMTPIYYIVYSVASASDIDFLLMFYLVFLLPLWCGQNTLGFWPPSRIKLPDKRTRNYFIVERCSIISPFMGVKVASVRALSSILVVKDYIQWQNKSTQNYCCTIANISISTQVLLAKAKDKVKQKKTINIFWGYNSDLIRFYSCMSLCEYLSTYSTLLIYSRIWNTVFEKLDVAKTLCNLQKHLLYDAKNASIHITYFLES